MIGAFGRRCSDDFLDVMIPEAIHEAVGADDKTVSGMVADRADLRVYKLVACAERLVKDVAARMRAGFVVLDFSIPQEPRDMRVVLRELEQFAFALRQLIDPRVADVSEIRPARREPGQTHGGLHPLTFVVAIAEISQRAVNLLVKFGQHVAKAGVEAALGMVEGARQQRGDFLDGDVAGEVAGLRAAHAVAHGEGVIMRGQRRLAELAEPLDFLRVEPQAEKGILVVLAHAADIGPAEPLQFVGAGGVFLGSRSFGFHGFGGGSGKMVANSKSITQKRPSEKR